MPKIPTYTAQTGPGLMPASTISPNSFGAQAFEGISGLGKEFDAIGRKIQDNQDRIDLTNLSSQAAIQLDAAKHEIAKQLDLTTHADALGITVGNIQDRLLESTPNVSSAVETTFRNHMTELHAKAAIDLAHEGQVLRMQRAVADFDATTDRLTQRAALEPNPDLASQHLATLENLGANMVRSGLLRPVDAQKRRDSARHQYWNTFAQHRPQELLDLVNEPRGSGNIAGMDGDKLNIYVNVAVSTLHARQSQADQAQKQDEAEWKKRRDVNKSALQADVIAGKPVLGGLAELVRTREIDGDAVAPLLALQKTLIEVPDMSRYQRGLATQIETELNRMKYDNQPFDQTIVDGLQSDFMQGHLLKEEFTHLAGLARVVEAHKADAAKTPKNSAIAHAAANLEQVMESANKLTGFSAVGNQATAAAKEYFYRRVEQEPNANPWDVMHDASTRFKPIVEKQQGISRTDQMLLDDAKIDAQVKLKTMSPAAAKAYRDTTQDDRARKIVSDALKALPPPPEPGFFERLFQKQQAERKPAGVMGQ